MTSLVLFAAAAVRLIRFSDLPPEFQTGSERAFATRIEAITRKTAAREREGEYDHLIYFLLQSRRFTRQPPLEPALSARQFIESGRQAPPEAVSRRMQDFLAALQHPQGERLAYFASLHPTLEGLRREYARAMRWLYQKEFRNAGASWYQTRGLSTDTQIEANFAVHLGLEIFHALRPGAKLNRILIVGPGLDLAPRTGLVDRFPPQSYQPLAVADALLELGLSDPEHLRLHSVDIQPTVVRFLQQFTAGGTKNLLVVSHTADTTPEFQTYFAGLGRRIGRIREQAANWKAIEVNRIVAQALTAERLNIITERYEPSPKYDLVVATNVFPYFDAAELRLALVNLRSMMAPGGVLVHNEPRPELEADARVLGMPPIQARSVEISRRAKPLYDVVVIHEIPKMEFRQSAN